MAMAKNNTLTVVIPTYKRPRLLKRAILSVMKQNYADVKITVFDNNSGDETREVVENLILKDSRISYHCHEKNIGAMANFAFGTRQVNTGFFAFLSDDDIILPNCYCDAIAIMKTDTKIMFVANKVLVIDEHYNLSGRPLDRYKCGRFDALKAMSTIPIEYMPPWTGTTFRSDIITSIGVPDAEVFIGDVEYITRICYHFPYFLADKIGAIFTIDRTENKKERYVLEAPAGRERMYDLFQSKYGENKAFKDLWARERKKHYKKLFKKGVRWIHTNNHKYATDAALILINYQSKLKGRFLLWLVRTTNGKRFFSVVVEPYFKAKYFFRKKKSLRKSSRVPNDDEVKCINYFKLLENEK